MTFVFINFEMLPIGENDELGKDGYIELFKKIVTQQFTEAPGDIGRNKFITFDFSSFKILDDVLLGGDIIIYKKPKPYQDMHTGEITREPKENEVEKSIRLKFFFESDRHILVIQKHSSEMNNPYVIEKKLRVLFEERIQRLSEYNDYRLELITLTKREELDKVINETQVASIKIDLTFPNGEDLESALLNDLKQDRGKLEYTEKSYSGSYMRGISKVAKMVATLAPRYGNVIMRYIDQETHKLKRFILRNKPIIKEIKGKEPEKENLLTSELIKDNIDEALAQSKISETKDE